MPIESVWGALSVLELVGSDETMVQAGMTL
ncbi:hypothetical protein ABIC28_000899 [Rhodococcus sp. PvR044]|nr:hypothetical protein [Rhodococcus sp. PvR099]